MFEFRVSLSLHFGFYIIVRNYLKNSHSLRVEAGNDRNLPSYPA